MKLLTPFLLSFVLLFAFDNQSLLLANDSVPVSHLPSSISYLSVAPKLMMDPSSVEEGSKAVGKTLRILGEGAITTERTVVGEEGTSSVRAGRTRVGRETTRKEELTTVSKIADCRSKVAACSLKFEEATVAGNQDLAALWHQALKQHEESAEYYRVLKS